LFLAHHKKDCCMVLSPPGLRPPDCNACSMILACTKQSDPSRQHSLARMDKSRVCSVSCFQRRTTLVEQWIFFQTAPCLEDITTTTTTTRKISEDLWMKLITIVPFRIHRSFGIDRIKRFCILFMKVGGHSEALCIS